MTELNIEEEDALLRLYPQRTSLTTYDYDDVTLDALARRIRKARKPTPTLDGETGMEYTYIDGEWRFGVGVLKVSMALSHWMTRLWNAENPDNQIGEVTDDE